MITLIAVILAAICNAVMDTLAHHYAVSIFIRFNRYYWDPAYSWRNKYIDRDVPNGLRFKFPFAWIANFLDAWHLFKMLMLIFIFITIIFYKPTLAWYWEAVIFYVAWNGTFELFYGRLFKR